MRHQLGRYDKDVCWTTVEKAVEAARARNGVRYGELPARVPEEACNTPPPPDRAKVMKELFGHLPRRK